MKLKYIDALRGLAILGVLIVHCSMYGINVFFPSIVSSILNQGSRGVQLFYIASAFTLFFSMNRRYENEKFPKINFFIRRFFRIAPMYYIGIFYYLWQDGFGARYWLGDANSISIGNILSNIFFIHGFNPYWITSIVPGGWSIAVEMLFYCFVPLLFIKIKNTQQAYIFVLITLFFRLFLQLILHQFQFIGSSRLWNEYLFFYFPSQLPIFALGILFYFIVKENYLIKISPNLIILTSVILIGQFVGLSLLPNHFLFGFAFVILAIAMSKSEFILFQNPVIIHIGKISYSMYLVHFAVLHWLTKINFIDYLQVSNTITALLNYGIRLLILIVLSVIISTIFYKFIEIPLQNIGKRLIEKINITQKSNRIASR
jgi:peptidoglycan/LPS O-acetylase OafA/YrhL